MKQGDVTTQDEAVLLPLQDIDTFTRDISIASGTQAVTGIGFRPRHIIILATKTSTGTLSIGFGHSGNDQCICNKEEDNPGQWTTFTNKSVCLITSGSDQYEGNVLSLDVDGFTMNWTKGGSPTGTPVMRFMAIK